MLAARLTVVRLLACGAMLLLLSACAAKNVERNYRPNASTGTGLLIGSISTDNENSYYGARSSVHFGTQGADGKFNNMGLGDRHRIEIFSGDYLEAAETDFTDRIGKVFVVELPVGRYAFYNWSIATGTAIVRPKGEVQTLPFEISAGKATYVGNFHGRLQTSERLFGLSVISNGVISLGSEIKRDLATIRRLYPNLKEIEVTPALPPAGAWLRGRVSNNVEL